MEPIRAYMIGLDPGVTGGWAVINRHQPKEIRFGRMPLLEIEVTNHRKGRKGSKTPPKATRVERFYDLPGIVKILGAYKPEWSQVWLEKVAAMPKDGAIGAFKFGDCFGQLKGVVAALQLPVEQVPAIRWTALMCPTPPGEERSKKRNVQAANDLLALWGVPGWQDIKLSDGEADAILIAAYGARQASALDRAMKQGR